MKTGKDVNADIAALIKSRHAFLWVVTREETRVERAIVEACSGATYEVRFWDVATGLTATDGRVIEANPDPSAVLAYIGRDETRCVYVLRDYHVFLRDPVTARVLKSLVKRLQGLERKQARAIVVLSPVRDVPVELQPTMIEYPLPDRSEIATIVKNTIERLPPDLAATAIAPGDRDAVIDAVVGLTSDEASNCFAKSLVTDRRLDPIRVSAEKKRVIERDKVLQWYDPDPRGFDSVGGLETLKSWAIKRKLAFSSTARDYGLPAPKGVLIVGVSGCGKSQLAKALGAGFGMPLLRCDLGGLKSKFVGESEANIRKALDTARTMAPCVLWFDEIEKALAGASGPQGDGGVSTDALGTLLTWMQENDSPVFVVATANDVRGLPPEFMRKGRFDEVFFVDLPTKNERREILTVTLKSRKVDPKTIDLDAISNVTDGFTGAEVAAIVPDAMFDAFSDGARPLATSDLIRSAKSVVPLSKTSAEKVTELREWAKGRARTASKPDEAPVSIIGGDLDLDPAAN